jgi:hypothetical protein
MVARSRNHEAREDLVVTLTDGRGGRIFSETYPDRDKATTAAFHVISTRGLQAGDVIHVTVPPPDGEVHNNPRETD